MQPPQEEAQEGRQAANKAVVPVSEAIDRAEVAGVRRGTDGEVSPIGGLTERWSDKFPGFSWNCAKFHIFSELLLGFWVVSAGFGSL